MAVTFNIQTNLNGWSPLTYVVGNRITSGGNAYQCTFAGSSTSAPTGTGSAINNGGVAVFKWLSAADFTTLPAAIAALPSTFTQPITWAFWNNGTILTTGTSPFATLTGHTTTSTNNLTWTCAPGEGIRDALHGGHTALAFNAAAGVSFTLPATNPGFHVDYFDIFDANVVFDGLQFQNPNATNGCSVLAVEPAGAGFVARNCIFDYTAQAGMTQLGFYAPSYVADNSLFADHQPVTGGEIGVKAEAAGAFVNCTAVAPNAPASAVFIVSDVASVGAVVVRNCACFGYVAGIATSAVTTGAVVIDHCATSANSIGGNNTDAGGNLLSRSATTSLTSLANDARPILGSSLLNVGVTDTTDISTADDIARTSRPQGAAWDIGALEFLPVRLRGASQARGKGVLSPQLSLRGRSQGSGRCTLLVTATLPIGGFGPGFSSGFNTLVGPITWTGRALSKAFGSASPSYSQVVQLADPWTGDFTTDFGPLTVGVGALSGQSRASGKATIAGALPLTAAGRTAGQGRASGSFFGRTISRGSSTASARAIGQFTQVIIADPWSADFSFDFGPLNISLQGIRGTARSIGKAAGQYILASTATGFSKSAGSAVYSPRGLISGKGSATARGKSVPPPTAALLQGVGKARGSAAAAGLFSAPASANRGRSATQGRATIAAATALQAVGTTAATGNLLYASNALILNVRGGSQTSAASAAMGLAAAPAAAGIGRLSGQAQINIAQSVTASGVSRSRAITTLLYNGLLTSRGLAAGRGSLGGIALAVATNGRGSARAKARISVSLTAALSTKAAAVSRALTVVSSRLPLIAIGISKTSGAIGANTRKALQAGGTSVASGSAIAGLRIAVTATGRASAAATPMGLFVRTLAALGRAGLRATSLLSTGSQIRTLGTARTSAVAKIAGQTPLATTASAAAAGSATIQQRATQTAQGSAALSGSAVPAVTAALVARGCGVSVGRVNGLGFAPVALAARGRSSAFAAARPGAALVLSGASVGLSAGRCTSIQTSLLLATGRSHGFGRLQAVSALGLGAQGNTRAAGRLFTRHAIDGLGRALSQGQSRLSGGFNVTPDVTGPRLSTIGTLPVFDAMDLSDVDFFSFDWSARASVLGDPIVSATVIASPSGMAVGQAVVSGSIVQVRVAAGSLMETFSLRCSVTLRSGRVLHWSAAVPVADF